MGPSSSVLISEVSFVQRVFLHIIREIWTGPSVLYIEGVLYLGVLISQVLLYTTTHFAKVTLCTRFLL